MQVNCIHCERIKSIDDCWCCIDKGARHYECKNDEFCENFKVEQKRKKEAFPATVETPPKAQPSPEIPFTNIALQTMEIEDWNPQAKSKTSIFSIILSIFSVSSYTKIKNE